MSLSSLYRHSASLIPAFTRAYQSQATLRAAPAIRGSIDSPAAFLKAIGRNADSKLDASSVDWVQFWSMGGSEMRKANVDTKDRRYIMWAMEKYRQGYDPANYASPATPKKKIRGWGPSVQFGKRIRSRRKQ